MAEPSSVAHSGKKATAAASSAERGAHTETVTAQLAAALAGDQGYASSSQAAMRRWCFASGQSGARHVMREDLMQ